MTGLRAKAAPAEKCNMFPDVLERKSPTVSCSLRMRCEPEAPHTKERDRDTDSINQAVVLGTRDQLFCYSQVRNQLLCLGIPAT